MAGPEEEKIQASIEADKLNIKFKSLAAVLGNIEKTTLSALAKKFIEFEKVAKEKMNATVRTEQKTLTAAQALFGKRMQVQSVANQLLQKEYTNFNIARREQEVKFLNDLLATNAVADKKLLQSHIRRKNVELELEKLKVAKIRAEEEGFLSMMSVRWRQGVTHVGEFMIRTFGKGGKIAGALLGMSGIVGGAMLAFTLLMKAMDYMGERVKTTTKGMLLSGGLISKSYAGIAAVATEVSGEFITFNQIGMTVKKAQELYNEGLSEGLMSLTLYTEAQNNHIDIMKMTARQQINLNKLSIVYSKELGTIAQAIFLNTKDAAKFYQLAKNYHITLGAGFKNLAAGIGQWAISLKLDTEIVFDTLNAMGEQIRFTGKGIEDTLHTFVPFVEMISQVGEKSKMSRDDIQELIKTFTQVGKSVDPFLYMATQDWQGKVGEGLMKTFEVSPWEKFLGVMGKFQEQTDDWLGAMMLQFPELQSAKGATLLKTLEAAKARGPEEISKLRGMTTQELAQYMLEQGHATTEEVAKSGAALMAYGSTQDKIADYVERIFQAFISFTVKFFNSRLMKLGGAGDAAAEMMKLKGDVNSITKKGFSTSDIALAAGFSSSGRPPGM